MEEEDFHPVFDVFEGERERGGGKERQEKKNTKNKKDKTPRVLSSKPFSAAGLHFSYQKGVASTAI